MSIHSMHMTNVGRSPRGFSLIEVLMAIFILGIGAISIAALFPAGIAQQRRSVDDVIGPIVANNALSILRGKLEPGDFGSFEEFSPFGATLFAPRITVEGDWSWLRPSVIFEDDTSTNDVFERGAIDIFSRDWFDSTTPAKATEFQGNYSDLNGTSATPDLHGLPYSRRLYGDVPPRILLTQRERYYPMATVNSAEPPRPEYVWDCMFRRFQGRVLVAIFVYRVRAGGGEPTEYFVPQDGSSTIPPLPVWVDLVDAMGNTQPWQGNPWNSFGAVSNDVADDALIPGTYPDDEFDIGNIQDQWQIAGQWIIDQNMNVHRVLSGRENESDGPVELIRPVPSMPAIPVNYVGFSPLGFPGNENVVTDIWYLPASMTDADGRELRLTPVYVTVKEL